MIDILVGIVYFLGMMTFSLVFVALASYLARVLSDDDDE